MRKKRPSSVYLLAHTVLTTFGYKGREGFPFFLLQTEKGKQMPFLLPQHHTKDHSRSVTGIDGYRRAWFGCLWPQLQTYPAWGMAASTQIHGNTSHRQTTLLPKLIQCTSPYKCLRWNRWNRKLKSFSTSSQGILGRGTEYPVAALFQSEVTFSFSL